MATALAISSTQNAFFANFMDQLAALAGRYKLPAMYTGREFAEAGGLVSYGPDFADGYRHAGLYAAKILKGLKPADLPVMQSIKYCHKERGRSLSSDVSKSNLDFGLVSYPLCLIAPAVS